MSRAEELELETTRYVLGLDALGLGLGAKGFAILHRCQLREIRPLLLKQRSALERGRDPDGRLEIEIEGAWERCLDQLKTLWLTEGRGLEDAEVA